MVGKNEYGQERYDHAAVKAVPASVRLPEVLNETPNLVRLMQVHSPTQTSKVSYEQMGAMDNRRNYRVLYSVRRGIVQGRRGA